VELAIAVRLAWSMRGVCDKTSPVKANVIACGSATLDAVVTGSVVITTEVVEVQLVVMQANANVN